MFHAAVLYRAQIASEHIFNGSDLACKSSAAQVDNTFPKWENLSCMI